MKEVSLSQAEHYIPKFYLKNFATKSRGAYYTTVYDLKKDNIFTVSIVKIAQETGFYNIEFGDKLISMESALSKLESNIAPVLKKLIEQINPNILTKEERVYVSNFCATLMMRVPRTIEIMEDINEKILNEVGQRAKPELLKQLEFNKKDKKIHLLNMLKKSIGIFSPIFFNMKWSISQSKFGSFIHTSDNPLVRYNPIDMRPYGNLGLLCRGIQIFLPLNSYLQLNMFHEKDYSHIDYFSYLNKDNVLFIKSLLVGQATRFLIGKSKDVFDVREGIRKEGNIFD